MNNIYLDDIRPTPPDFNVRLRTVNGFAGYLLEGRMHPTDVISFDHDAGDFEPDGGDYNHAFRWLVDHCISTGIWPYEIRFHSDNKIGVANMQSYIDTAIRIGMCPMVKTLNGNYTKGN